jgi:hypothetical protein
VRSEPGPEGLRFPEPHRSTGQGTENEEASELLREIKSLTFIDASLGARKAYAHAASQGSR